MSEAVRSEFFLKNFMAPFYGWGSTTSRLQPLRGGSLQHLTESCQAFLQGILSIWQKIRNVIPICLISDKGTSLVKAAIKTFPKGNEVDWTSKEWNP